MKKHIFSYPLLLVLGLFCPVLFSANTHPATPAFNNEDDAGCMAPTPAYFVTTGVTPTSISLAWGPFSPFTYYKLEGFDNTNFTALPTVYLNAGNYTYTGLLPGHDFTFTLRASYCPTGPWSLPIMHDSRTGIIIVDDVVGVQGCTPNTNRTIIPGEPFGFGVKRSSTLPPQTLTDAYVAQFSYSGYTYRVGLAFVPNNYAVYKKELADPDNRFSFTSTDNGASAICKFYNNGSYTDIFTVKYLGTSNLADFVNMEMKFHQSVSNYSYCGDYTGGLGYVADNGDEEAPAKITFETEDRSATDESITGGSLGPNPFSTHAVYQYTLAQESNVSIGLYNATGELVQTLESNTLKAAGSHEASVDGSALPDGVYFLRVQTGSQLTVHTLLKRE